MSVEFKYDELVALDGSREVQVVFSEASGQRDDGIVEVRYLDIPLGAMAGVTEWLQANRQSLVEAEINGVRLRGTWRCISIRERLIESKTGKSGVALVQQFGRGLHADFNVAGLRIATGETTDGNEVAPPGVPIAQSNRVLEERVVILPFVVRAVAATVAAKMRSRTWGGEQIDGETLSGTWIVVSSGYKIEQDGTATVWVRLAKPKYTVMEYTGEGMPEGSVGWLCTDVPLDEVQEIIDAWRMDGNEPRIGASASVRSIHTERRLATVLLALERESEREGWRTSQTETCFEVVTETVDRAVDSLETLPQFTQGTIVTVENQQTPLGKYNVSVTARVAKYKSDFGRSVSEDSRSKTVTEEQKNAATAIPDQPESEGVIHTTQSRRNEFCKWDTSHTVESAKRVDDSVIAELETTYEKTRMVRDAEVDEPRENVTSADGVIRRHTVEKSRFPGRYIDTVEEREARQVDSASTIQRESVYEIGVTTKNVGREATSVVQQEPGKLIEHEVEKSEYPDRVNETISVRQVKPVELASREQSGTTFEIQETERNVGMEEASEDAQSGPGEIVVHTVEKSEFPERINERIARRKSVAVEEAEKSIEIDTFTTLRRTRDVNLESEPELPTECGSGERVSVAIQKSEFPQRYHFVSSVEESKKVEDAILSERETAFEHTKTTENRGLSSAELVSPPVEGEPIDTVGEILEVRTSKSEFKDRYNQLVTKRKAYPGETPQYDERKTHDGITVLRRRILHVDPASNNAPGWINYPANQQVGFGVILRKEKNEFGGLTVERVDIQADEKTRPEGDPGVAGGWYRYSYGTDYAYYKEFDGIAPSEIQDVLDSVATLLGTTHTVHPSFDFEPTTGTFSLRITAVPFNGRFSGNTGIQAVEIGPIVEIHRIYTNRVRDDGLAPETWYRDQTWQVAIKQHPGKSTVENWVSNAASGALAFTWSIDPIGDWGYRAQYRKLVSSTPWTLMPPSGE